MFLIQIILVTINSVILAASTDNGVIVFNVIKTSPDHYECTPDYHPIIIEDEPVTIHVNNDININSGDCYDGDWNQIILHDTDYKVNTFSGTIRHVSKFMGKKWTCYFYALGPWRSIECNTLVHLRTKSPVAEIYLNLNKVAATPTNFSVKEYDALATYLFEDGESVYVDCKRSNKYVSSKMVYFTNTGQTLLESVEPLTHLESVLIKLTKECHFNYVDCSVTARHEDISVTRILFKLQSADADKSIITLYINGMYVRSTGSAYNYVYKEGEKTDIVCELRNDDNNFLILDYDEQSKKGLSKANITLQTKYNKEISCTAIDTQTKHINESVSVKLIQSFSDFYVSGLTKSNILKQYQETEHTLAIYYQYTADETLSLNCLKSYNNRVSLGWEFNDTSYMSTTYDTSIYLQKTLQASDDNSTIECIIKPYFGSSKSSRHIAIRFLYKITPEKVDQEGIITLYINGMYVRPTRSVYKYVYNAGEKTDIVCELKNDYHHFLNMDYNEQSQKGSKSKSNITLYLDNNNNNTDVKCIAIDTYTNNISKSLSVKLIQSLSDIYVTGLTEVNILKQYQEMEHTLVISYQYTAKEILSLNCSKSNYDAYSLGWMFNDTSVISTSDITSIHLPLVLKASDDNSTIKCILRRSLDYSRSVTRQIVIRFTYKITPDNVDQAFASKFWIGISVSILIIIISIVIILYVGIYFRNKRIKRLSSDTSLAVSPNTDYTPLPHPSQWNEVNNAMMTQLSNNEPIYENKTQKNKKSKPKQTVQKKPLKCDSDNNYANVGYTNRNDQEEPALNYADILIVNNTEKFEKPDAPNYSVIQIADTRTGSSNYANSCMIQGPSYVNTDVADDQAELYCEVQFQGRNKM